MNQREQEWLSAEAAKYFRNRVPGSEATAEELADFARTAVDAARTEERRLCYVSLADTIRTQAETIRHLSDNLDATQSRASELMAVAQAAAWYLRSLDDVVVAEQLREALKKVWPEFDRP